MKFTLFTPSSFYADFREGERYEQIPWEGKISFSSDFVVNIMKNIFSKLEEGQGFLDSFARPEGLIN